MKMAIPERIERAKTDIKNLFSREIAIENMAKSALVVLAFLAVILPVIFAFLSRSAIFPESGTNPDIDYSTVKKFKEPPAEKDIREINIDASAWKSYSNNWYGFQVKYPENWKEPVAQRADPSSSFEYRYLFRKAETGDQDDFLGFDVVVYNLNKVEGPIKTDEIVLKNVSHDADGEEKCRDIDGHLAEYEEFPAEEISIPRGEKCFEQAYLFSLTRDSYIYNIVPALNGNPAEEKNLEGKIKREFPEFIASAKSFELTKIIRLKLKPKITAPKPLADVKIKNGKRYCAKKNDKPKKSKVHKEKHMDMECCLDPDEYPNPWCTY